MQHPAPFVHPRQAVRFSPYSLVGTGDLVFAAGQLRTLPGSTTKYDWGVYEGVGYSTDLTFDDYYAQFVYSHDFLHAEQIGYSHIIGRGNMVEWIGKVYVWLNTGDDHGSLLAIQGVVVGCIPLVVNP
jgi:hypothetical protein